MPVPTTSTSLFGLVLVVMVPPSKRNSAWAFKLAMSNDAIKLSLGLVSFTSAISVETALGLADNSFTITVSGEVAVAVLLAKLLVKLFGNPVTVFCAVAVKVLSVLTTRL